MGDDNREEAGRVTPRREQIYDWAGGERERISGAHTPFEQEYIPISQGMYNRGEGAAQQAFQDYGNIMGGYRDWRSAISERQPTKFQYTRDPSTIGRAVSGYGEFADTGGYSPTDIQELRARGVSPIRSSYANAMRNIERQRALQGGYSPNYTAAAASMQRQLPQQLADATTSVNAELANAIRSGRLAGMQGLTSIGGFEAPLKMRADELTEQALAGKEGRQLAGLEAERALYGTTPAMAATFGEQAQRAYAQRAQMEQLRNQQLMGYGGLQLESLGQQRSPGKPWWQTGIELGTSLLPFF